MFVGGIVGPVHPVGHRLEMLVGCVGELAACGRSGDASRTLALWLPSTACRGCLSPPPPSSPPAASCGSKTRSCIASMIAKTHTVTLYLDIKTFRVSQFVVEDPRWVHSQTHMYTKYSP